MKKTAPSDSHSAPRENAGTSRPMSAPDAPAPTATEPAAPHDMKSLGTVIPEQLAEATEAALGKLRDALGGDVSGYVADRLGFTPDELAAALAQEQVEGVAMAIYNIEARSQSVIIGDQTGIGKGRQAAAMVRYGIRQGYFPVFFTDRYTLFSDMYRDCKALGIAQEPPLVLNQKVSVVDFDRLAPTALTDDEDENWNPDDEDASDTSDADAMALYRRQYMEVYCSPKKKDLEAMYAAGDVPQGLYSYIMVTYSQLKDARRDATRLGFIQSLCRRRKVLFVFDEAHRSSSVTAGRLSVITESINALLSQCADTQCVFLSATFAKRPECMVTFMKQTMLSSLATSSTLQKAFASGGVPMQEYVATMLANHGQMLRREQPDDGSVTTTYTYLEDQLQRHSLLFDRVMHYFRRIVELSRMVKEALSIIKEYGEEAFRAYPARQQLFYINKVLLLALKAADVARSAVDHVRQGRAVVIGMSDTLECVLRDTLDGTDGACPRADFHALLSRLLEKTVRNPKDPAQKVTDLGSDIDDDVLEYLMPRIRDTYDELRTSIDAEQFDLPLSPIDVIRQLITRHKWTDTDGTSRRVRFEECTGRARMLEYAHPDGKDAYMKARVVPRHKRHSNLIYNDFQNNKLDVILINATGAIGASAHATVTAEVDEAHVRQRVMLIVQNDLDVNLDLQKRGRINRTGQLEHLPPRYQYIITAIPSEKRLNMMLRAKLRSLSANTTANQDQDRDKADFTDIANRYGNQVAANYLASHPDLKRTLDLDSKPEASVLLARAAMLSVGQQQELIDDIFSAYAMLEQDLRRINQWDLEREFRDFEAEFISEELFTSPVDDSALGAASRLTRFMCRHRTYPYTAAAVDAAVSDARQRLGENLKSNRQLHKEIKAFYTREYDKTRQKFDARKEAIEQNYAMQLARTAGDAAGEIARLARQLAEYQDFPAKELDIARNRLTLLIDRCEHSDIVMDKCQSLIDAISEIDIRLEAALDEKQYTYGCLKKMLDCAVIGRAYLDVSDALDLGHEYERVMAVLIDVRFAKNPERRFLPGSVQFVFALSAGPRELVLNLSQARGSSNLSRLANILCYHRYAPITAQKWDAEIAKYNDRRLERYIITGNILGAFAHPAIGDLAPRFVTFSLKDSALTEYGLLLPFSGEGLEQALAHVTLPLAEGMSLATSPNVVYRITGAGADMSLVCGRSRDGHLQYTLKVHDADCRTFETDPNFDSIRPLFTTSPLSGSGLRSGRPSKKAALRFKTDPLDASSHTLRKIIDHLAALRAVLLIPRHNLTIGAEKRFNKRAVIDDSASWPALPWREGAVTPPERLAINRPVAEITENAATDGISPLAALAQETILCLSSATPRDLALWEKLHTLRDRWEQTAQTTDDKNLKKRQIPTITYFIDEAIQDYRHHGMVWLSDRLRMILTSIINKEFDARIADILATFRREYVAKAPDRDAVLAFLNSCPSDPRLRGMAKSIEAYARGDFPVVADI